MRHDRGPAARLLVPSLVPLLVCVGAVLSLAAGCLGGPPGSGSPDPSPAAVLADAVAVTGAADTGRVRLAVEIGVDVPPVPRTFRAALESRFDRTRAADAAALDMSDALAGVPEMAAAFPSAAGVDGVELRVLDGDAWVRFDGEERWSRRSMSVEGLADLGGLLGADAMLELVGAALDEGVAVEVDRDGLLTGHLGIGAVLAARPGRPVAGLSRAAEVLPPALAERAFRFEAEVDDGSVERLAIHLDVEGLAEELGEPVPDGVVLRWSAEWRDLGEPVEIPAPE